MKRIKTALALSSVCTLLALGAAGCNGPAAPMNQDEKANFKGGPMPEAARKAMAEGMARGRAKAGGAPGAPAEGAGAPAGGTP